MEYSQFLYVFALIVSAIVVVLMQVWKYIQFKHPVPYYNFLIKLNPRDSRACYNKGLAYYRLRKYHLAITDFERAIALDPKFVKAYYYIGYANFCLKDYQKAIAYYSRTLDLHPNYVQAYMNSR